ncbi:hypothetical protein DNHGIG_34740 [Collibacillus ludicampi]|uniref:Spo0E family sporulation regulatory protein-aspartic acid phosphatase n=1 Tax=Collibacillus ludicampi TaxID=2771369 RepID=A0AAV4LJK6_9BACL|nr:hypothetical protein [Collibacillus ludicampi]GIM47925.1 hypothetical protein DNHGIG_34740 [Collibacillus ludicampi]
MKHENVLQKIRELIQTYREMDMDDCKLCPQRAIENLREIAVILEKSSDG